MASTTPVNARFVNYLPVFWIVVAGILVSACSLWESPNPDTVKRSWVRTSDTPESEVKASFVNIMRISQARDVNGFRKLIDTRDVVEFDADEGEHAGSYADLMAAIASHPLKDYRIDFSPDRAVFTADPQKPKLGDDEKTRSTLVVLVRNDGRWQIARSPDSDRSLTLLDTLDAAPKATVPSKSRRPKGATKP